MRRIRIDKVIALSAVALCLAFPSVAVAAPDGKPNIVLILADDVSPDMFSCYGQAGAARTPNIDRIGREGVLFRTCYAPAICAPSRALLMTGKYSTTTGVYHNGLWLDGSRGNLFTKQHSWAKLLRTAGYATAIAGKWHCGALDPWEPEVGFDEYCLWEGTAKILSKTGVDVHAEGLREKIEQSDTRYWHPATLQNGKYVRVKRSDFGPDIRCRFLIDFMERMASSGKPFLAYWPTVIPHGPYSTTPLAGEVMDISPTRPDLKGLRSTARAAAIEGYEKNVRRRFVNLVEYMDLLVGKLLAKAEALGIADNTYFIFCSDNGTANTAKNRGVERGCHVPFVLMGPRVQRAGPTDELMDFSDVAPTLLEMAGAGPTPGSASSLDGKSLLPYVSGAESAHRKWIYGYVGASQVLRTRHHMLEAVNHMFDSPRGRFYYTGDHRFGRGYLRADGVAEHASARDAFTEILAQLPPLRRDNPHWQSRKGRNWLQQNDTPEAVERHLHNHKDYRFYDEAPPAAETP